MNHRTALGALHIGALFFGLTGVFGKLAASASPAIIVFGRAAFAVIALALFAQFASKGWHRLTGPDVRRLLLGGVLLAGHWVSFFIAVKVGGVAIATLGFASFPAFTVILEGVLFRERIRRNEAVLVVLVCIGLVLVTPAFDLASQATGGLLWALLSGLLFSLLSLTNRAGSGRLPAVQAALWQNLVVSLCLLPFAASGLAAVTPMDWVWIALLGIFCTGAYRRRGVRYGAGVWHRRGLGGVRRDPYRAHAAGGRADHFRHRAVQPPGCRTTRQAPAFGRGYVVSGRCGPGRAAGRSGRVPAV